MTGHRRRVIALLATVAIVSAAGASPTAALDQGSGSARETAVALSPCASSDNGDPVVVSASVTPTQVDVRRQPATILVRLEVADTGGPGPATGASRVRAQFGPVDFWMQHVPDGTWQHQVVVPVGSDPGVWELSLAWPEDHAGNSTIYGSSELINAGLAATAIVTSVADTAPPVLRALTLSRSVVDARRHVRHIRVSARVTDNVAVREVSVTTSRRGRRSIVPLHRTSGTTRDGRWVGALTIGRWQDVSAPTWKLTVKTSDAQFTESRYAAKELAHRHFPASIAARTLADATVPRARRASASAPVVDVRSHDGKITVTMHGLDARSGVASAVMSLKNTRGIFPFPMRRVAGSIRHGTWRVTVPIRRCDLAAGSGGVQFVLTDRAGHQSWSAWTVLFQVRNADIGPPYLAPSPQATHTPAGPFTIVFSEDVTGVSEASAVIRTGLSTRGTPHGLPPAVSGSWSCQSAGGVDVDCRSGVLRRATWSPAQPLSPGARYYVDLLPEHVPTVTDVAGNPMGGYLVTVFGAPNG